MKFRRGDRVIFTHHSEISGLAGQFGTVLERVLERGGDHEDIWLVELDISPQMPYTKKELFTDKEIEPATKLGKVLA